MRLKGVNPFEQHIEKAVLGAVGAVALGVLAWQYLGPPNTVKVKNAQHPVHEAWAPLATEAQSVQSRIRQESVEPPDFTIPEMLARFERERGGLVARTAELAWAGETGGPIIRGPSTPVSTRLQVQALAAPAPTTPTAATYLATISPAEVENNPGLAALLPEQMPFDKAAVSVETTYSGTALAQALSRDPDGDGPLSALPRHWWDGRMQILAVELQREELQADGSWSNLVTVPPPPGRYSLHEELAAGVRNQPALFELVTEATQHASAIRRMPYYATIMGEDWVPPTEARVDFRPPNQAEINRWTQQYQDALRQIERFEEQLNQVVGEDASSRNRRQGIQRSIDQQTQRRDAARRELRNLGAPVEGDLEDLGEHMAEEQTETPLLSDSAVRLWAHDVTVERGKTYRYRVVAVLPNPIFGQTAAISTDLAPLAGEPLVRSAPSPWTQPVQVDPYIYYWITSAQDQPAGGAMGGGPRAAAELYIFKWGYWRKATTSLRPGDPIAADVRVPDFAAMRPDLVAPLPPVGNEPGRPEGQGQPPAAPADPPTPIYTQVNVAHDAYLLDVAALPVTRDRSLSQPGAQFQAFLRDSGGVITVRNPETDRGQSYQRVDRSARLGEQALRPKQIVRPQPRPDREPGRQPAPGKTGGGGSGGG